MIEDDEDGLIEIRQRIDVFRVFETNRLRLILLDGFHIRNSLLHVIEKNYKDDYIKPIYAERPEHVNFNYSRFNIVRKCREMRQLEEKCGGSETVYCNFLCYVITLQDDTIVGACEFYKSRENSVEVGVFIDFEHAGNGYAGEAIVALIALLRAHTDIETVKWDCDTDNARSVAVARKCGFTHHSDYQIYEGRMSSVFHLHLERD